MDVHEWSDDESDNGYVWTKDGYEIGGYHTPQELREALEEHFPGIDVSQEEDAYLHYDQIENEDGYRDDNGGFLVNYLIAVEKVRVDSFFLDAEREAA
jgi:hypothetical protein